MRNLLLVLHIGSVLLLVSGLALNAVIMLHLGFSRSVEMLRRPLFMEPYLKFMLPTGALAILVTGSLLVAESGAWQWDMPWVLVATAIVVFFVGYGIRVEVPELAGIIMLANSASAGPVTRGLRRLARAPRMHILFWIGWCSIIAVVYMMVAKPDLSGCARAVAAFIVIGSLLGSVLRRSVRESV